MPAARAAGPGRLSGQVGARPRPAARRTVLPARSPGAARRPSPGRTPFALLVVVLLAAGLIGLLTLNTALNQGSFELARLQRETTRLTDEQQSLEQQIEQWAAPDALDRRARQLGMVPAGNPAFLQDDGSILGVPKQATGTAPAAGTPAAQETTPQPSPQAAAAGPVVPDGALRAATARAAGTAHDGSSTR